MIHFQNEFDIENIFFIKKLLLLLVRIINIIFNTILIYFAVKILANKF